MQAIMVSKPGDELAVGEMEIPEPGPGEVLVRVLSAGVGPWDVHLRQGQWSGDYPYVVGAEFSGLVVGDTGADSAFEDGEPVYGFPGLSGCYAEYVTCQAEQMAPVPDGLDGTDAAAVPVDGLTALQGLTDVLGVGGGQTVLITAAAGGLGHLAVQIARVLGANVIATASVDDHEFLHTLGAADVVDHAKPDWPDQVRALAGGGVQRVLACSARSLEGAARAAGDGAIVATPVNAADYPDGERISWRRYDGQPSGSGLIRMAPWFDDGSLSVHVTRRFYWKDAPAAHHDLEHGRTRGKLLLVVDDDLAAESGL